jgi:lipopolysaccharide biosynthesis glycosyltransferase
MKKNIAFCLNDKYVNFCYVTIVSILKNKNPTDKIVFHLLTDYFSFKEQEKFKNLIAKSNDVVKIHIIDKNKFDGLNMNWSVYGWFRIVIPEVVGQEVSRVLYLDCDTIVNTNLDYLFNLDLSDKSIAAVIDRESFNKNTFERLNYPQKKQYICSGVLLINVDYWRAHNIAEKIYDFGIKYPEKTIFPDQCAINYVCQDSKIMLPLKFGIINNFFSASHRYNKNEILEAIESPEIIHYAVYAPWKYSSNHHFYKKIWWYYKRKSDLGYNTINFNYFKSMIIHYRKAIKFILTNFKAYSYSKPATISKKDILAKLK